MAARHLARLTGWALACAVPPVIGAAISRSALGIGVAIAIAGTVGLLLWLPRAAHTAFAAGRYRPAARRYRILAGLAFTAARERAAELSRAGCAIAAGDAARAARLLARFDGAALEGGERVTYLNNRACLALAAHDHAGALALVEQAVHLRPDVPAIQHTRASALVALGRADEAIGVLEAMRAGGELEPTLEALRCRELAAAWDHKGQPDYAADYRARAQLIAPGARDTGT